MRPLNDFKFRKEFVRKSDYKRAWVSLDPFQSKVDIRPDF